MNTSYIPAGYHTATPYLIVNGAARALEFYKQAFGATELMRHASPDGSKVMHAEIQIGDSRIMLADEFPEMNIRGPKALGGSPVSLMLYVQDVDDRFAQAVAAGASVKRPLADQFYGDRSGTLEDPFGHSWTIATHKEDLTMEQIEQRMAAQSQQGGSA